MSIRRGVRSGLARLLACLLLAPTLVLPGCSTLSDLGLGGGSFGGGPGAGAPGHVSGFLGGVVADEPRAALVAREVLSAGGSAADAATALGFALAVTLPSRAGLGGGGACLAYAASAKSVNGGVPEAILFTLNPATLGGARADRPAAVPTLARGLYLLHSRYGRSRFESLVAPAEALARFGTPASRALARDVALVSGPLFADPNAASVFGRGGVPIAEGQSLVQPDLATTLSQIRTAGVGDFFIGGLAGGIAQASVVVGGPVTVADLRAALPSATPGLVSRVGHDQVAFLPPPADGGLAAAAAFRVLQANPSDVQTANLRALAVAARWRLGHEDPEVLLRASDLTSAGLPALPASTSFATLDRDGNAVVCALSMDNLFGTGRILPGLGFLLAASPVAVPPPLYAAALAWNPSIHAFRAAVGGSGQDGAPLAVAVALSNTLRAGTPMPVLVPEPGRATVIACSRYLPGEPGSCGWAEDPREPGLAVGSN